VKRRSEIMMIERSQFNQPTLSLPSFLLPAPHSLPRREGDFSPSSGSWLFFQKVQIKSLYLFNLPTFGEWKGKVSSQMILGRRTNY